VPLRRPLVEYFLFPALVLVNIYDRVKFQLARSINPANSEGSQNLIKGALHP